MTNTDATSSGELENYAESKGLDAEIEADIQNITGQFTKRLQEYRNNER